MKRWFLATAVMLLCGQAWAAKKTIRVGAKGADYTTIQAAVSAAPEDGAIIRISPGTYREVVHVDKPGIEFRGDGKAPEDVVLVYGNSAASTCGQSDSLNARSPVRSW